MNGFKVPSLEQARSLLDEAGALNPGPWTAHSLFVAQAAGAIAEPHPQMDAEAATIFGLLHDIGRRAGVTGMVHAVDGYTYLESLGYSDAARICLTHSYPIPIALAGAAPWDGTPEQLAFVQSYLDSNSYTPYDRLIQLCDSLALPTGFCLMEKRLVDVALRYGFNEHTLNKWRAFFEIKTDLERAIGRSIYDLLPGVVGTTFDC